MGRDHGAGDAPAASAKVPALPSGPLQYLEATVSDVRYLAGDQTTKGGKVAQATVLIVGKTAFSLRQKYAFMARRESIDCAGRQIFDELAAYYDAAGRLKTNEIQSSSLGRPAEADDPEVAIVCADTPPKLRTLAGYRDAQRQSQLPPDNLLALFAASPKDADLAAWVCAAGARGHWNPKLPQQCDQAVTLNPKSTASLLDRGFLKVAIGKNASADADFQKALALEPDNASALFGRSLMAGLRGDRVASRQDRNRALDLDPRAPDWLEANYRVQISAEFRKR